MNRLTRREKREFIRRCKVLARRHGERISYHHCKMRLALAPGLLIYYNADADHTYVSIRSLGRKPENETWSLVVSDTRGSPRWGFDTHKDLNSYLQRMRGMMVLDDLADI